MWLAVAALTLLGLVLRLLAARGALWLDEAWSATFAEQAVTPLGVIWRINHDNNHILNTLWLQLVGPDAHPLAQRALAIATGTAAIPLAAMFCARRSTAAALVAALAFALSPILLTYGSEARGYAPMIAAFLAMLVLVDRWFEGDRPAPAIGLAILALLGTLAQVMMVAPLLAIIGWAGIVLWRRQGLGIAFRRTPAALGPALAASAVVLLVMLLAAHASPHGFTIGSYRPFAIADWITGIAGAVEWTLAIAAPSAWLALFGLAVAGALLTLRRRDPRAPFYALLIIACPVAYALFHFGNLAIPRYFLPSMAALLLLAAEALGTALDSRSSRRWFAAAALFLFTVGAVRLDVALIANRRGDPAAAIAAIRRASPAGATLMLPDKRLTPVLSWAARSAGYRLRIVGTSCGAAPFLLLDSDHPAADPAALHLCCGAYRVIASRRVEGLSGTEWRLYHRVSQ
ncbi:MAG: hypothetical protein ACTHM0_06015 [Sphingomonas sp.]